MSGLDGVRANLKALYSGERKSIANAMGEICSVLGAWAQGHHDWKPRTGNTDTSTRAAIVKADTEEIVLALTAGMDYDVFLELARDGKWAWLWPAMLANQERMRRILAKWGHAGLIGQTMMTSSSDELTEPMQDVMAGRTGEVGAP